nr:hypothetical protein [Tanacetum cinerariifolium]
VRIMLKLSKISQNRAISDTRFEVYINSRINGHFSTTINQRSQNVKRLKDQAVPSSSIPTKALIWLQFICVRFDASNPGGLRLEKGLDQIRAYYQGLPPVNLFLLTQARLTDDMMKTYNFLIDEIVLNLLANVNKVDNEMQ